MNNVPLPDGTLGEVPCYRAEFRLLNVVFAIIGYVADRQLVDISMSDDLSRMLLPLWPVDRQGISWPPVDNFDIVGGMSGLANFPVVGGPINGQNSTR
jgi:hypothetical protein